MSYRLGGTVRPVMVVPPLYVGPGDIVSGATAWWGLRAYSAGVAGTKAINLRASGNNATSDFNTLANGNLDVASISSFLTANGGSLFVTKIYDQTGNGNDMVQATAANQLAFNFSVLGSFPSTVMAGNQFLVTALAGPVSQPVTLSVVENTTTTSSVGCVGDQTGAMQLRPNFSAANTMLMYAGNTTMTPTCSDNAWHAIQAAFNGASSDFYLDGSSNAGSPGVSALGSNATWGAPSGVTMIGDIMEHGVWPIAFSGAQKLNVNSNQHSYWGF